MATRLSPTPAAVNSWLNMQKVRQIFRTSHTSLEERTKLVQEMFTEAASSCLSDNHKTSSTIQNGVRPDGTSGCEHYSSKCVLWCEACSDWFPCRRCHDDRVLSHSFDRQSCSRVGCTVCQTVQQCRKECSHCKTVFARYYCETCRLYDDSGAPVYHCPHCRVCRRGKGLGIDFEHCTKCNVCYSVAFFGDHSCREDVLHNDCPICQGFLFESTSPIAFVTPCHHALHRSCLATYLKYSSSCPICSTSIRDLSDKFSALDSQFENFPFRGFVHIRCNDCGEHGAADRRGKMAKCGVCLSYNTNVLRSLQPHEVDNHSTKLNKSQIRDIRSRSIHHQRCRTSTIWEGEALIETRDSCDSDVGSDLETEFLSEAVQAGNWETCTKT